MKKITSVEELKEAIQVLELKYSRNEQLLKEQFAITYEGIKPVNLLKSTFNDFVGAPDFKNDVLDSAVGMTAGYISRKLAVGVTHNPLKILFGGILQMGVTAIVSKNAGGIKSIIGQITKKFFGKKETAAP